MNRELHQWLTMCSETEREDLEDVDGSIDENEILQEELINCNTDSEQDASDNEEEDQPITEPPFYISRDKLITWQTACTPKTTRTRKRNFVLGPAGPAGKARNADTIIKAFHIFIDDRIIEIITNTTNIYIDSIKTQFDRNRDANNTDICEMKAFLGILYLAGVIKSKRETLLDLWNTNGTGTEAVYLTMSYKRFQFLFRCLRFDNVHDSVRRQEIDRLALIRDIFDAFVQNLRKSYTPCGFLTVGGQLLPFRGRCAFRQTLNSKNGHYGIKTYALVDVETIYTCNLEVYCGIQPTGPYHLSNNPHDVVKRLTEIVKGTGRNITMGNWFASIPLALDLLELYKLTMIGTLKKNNTAIPSKFVNTQRRPISSSLFGFNNDITLVSYVPKKNKNVLAISTMHRTNEINQTLQKPELIVEYKKTKCAVDLLNEMCENYSVARISNRWPLVVFFDILNIAGINSKIVYNKNTMRDMSRRNFLYSLSLDLVQPQMKRRFYTKTVPKSIRSRISILLDIVEPMPGTSSNETELDSLSPKRPRPMKGRCYICRRNRDKTSRTSCKRCIKFVCMEHRIILCNNCVND